MKVIIKLIFAATALAIMMGICVLGFIIYISYDLPQINSLADYNPPIPSRIYSKDGQLLMELAKERRIIADIEEIPQLVIDAFLSAEDDNFYNHSGIDYIGIIRAMRANVLAGKIVQGASTITQQVAKSLLLSSERTFSRKIRDLILAKKIEQKFSKKEILYLYLNQVYLGGGYYGIKAAVRGYYDKELSELTVAEAALIAGLLVAPGKYSPYVNPRRAKIRQNYVLGRMYATKKIDAETYKLAKSENIKIRIRRLPPMQAGYFTDWIRQKLIAKFGKDDFLTNGYEVITTIDWTLQKKAELEIEKGVEAIDKRQGYKGTLGFVKPEEMIERIKKQREKVYKDASKYFNFLVEGKNERNLRYTEEEAEIIVNNDEVVLESFNRWQKRYLEPGILENERIIDHFDIGKKVKAVVTKVDNNQRMIYANYAGVKLIIPYEYFKWAHERKIKIERNYWSYITRPSQIVKPGNIILVRILDKKKISVWKHINQKFKTINKDEKLIETIKKQRYLLAGLEQVPEAQGALMSISPTTGEIIAMVGGSNFKRSQFNRAIQSNRQPGSAFKPLIYAVGLENNFTLASTLLDSPQALGSVDSTMSWKPRNYDGKFKGTMTYRRALEVSRNIPTIRLTQDIGVGKIIKFVERLRLDVVLQRDLSLSLGSFGLNLLNLVKMYAIFPNGGQLVNVKSIISIKDRFGKVYHLDEDRPDPEEKPIEENIVEESAELPEEGEVLAEEKIKKQNPFLVNLTETQVYDRRLAYLMSNVLKGVVQNGTGKRTRDISQFIGGKTGTTNNFIDAWFLGFSSNIVTGVWTGFDNNKTLGWGETGAKSALPIWKEFMKLGLKRLGESDFKVPNGIVNVQINKKTGKLAKQGESSFIESFVEGTEPGAISSDGLDEGLQDFGTTILDNEDYYSDQ